MSPQDLPALAYPSPGEGRSCGWQHPAAWGVWPVEQQNTKEVYIESEKAALAMPEEPQNYQASKETSSKAKRTVLQLQSA